MGALTSLDEDILVISDDPSDSGVGGECLPSMERDILVIAEEPPSAGTAGLWWRTVRALGVVGAATGLVILIFASIGGMVREARREQCKKNLARIGAAFYEFQRVKGHLPAPAMFDQRGSPLLSWRVAILPELGYESLYARFHLDEPWDSPHNRALLREIPKEFACPGASGSRAGRTGYLAVVGPKTAGESVGTAFEPTRGTDFSEFMDGTSNTILVMEAAAPVPWTKPEDLGWTPDGPLPRLTSPHDGGAHFVFADTSVRFRRSSTSATILRALLTRNGGEVLGGG